MAAGMARRCENTDRLRSETVRVLITDGFVQVGDAVAVGGWTYDGAAELALQLRITANMVGMVMGVEDMCRAPAKLVQRFENGSGLARVDYADGLACGI